MRNKLACMFINAILVPVVAGPLCGLCVTVGANFLARDPDNIFRFELVRGAAVV